MRFPSGIVLGNQGVIDGTLATLAEMPDRQLLGEDVIWSGDEDAGFLSSHRLVTSGTHTGHGRFGPPTGRSFTIRVIADCAAKNDVIYDEWLIRDYSGIANQLGFDTVEFTRDRDRPRGRARRRRSARSPPPTTSPALHLARQRQRMGRSGSPTS